MFGNNNKTGLAILTLFTALAITITSCGGTMNTVAEPGDVDELIPPYTYDPGQAE
ncbi:hypothetical protein JW859_07280 [bacterium]|nr:hypothetical protein [bacterium]